MSETRKLAAILVADVVGYGRLASMDEDRTLARLRALRSDLIDPTIAVHHGRVVKRTGDGAIVEFRSVVDALRCAIEIQNAMVERNAGVPEDRRIDFRIGIHLGDVIEEGRRSAWPHPVGLPGKRGAGEDRKRELSAMKIPVMRRDTRKKRPRATKTSDAELDSLIEEATVDAYDESEQMIGFHTMLSENLEMPFKTQVLGVEVKVEKLDLTDDNQIAVICTRGKSSQRIPILDLPLPKPPPEGAEWIDAYRRWGCGR